MSDTINTPAVKAKITWINDDPTAPRKAAATITIADSFQVHGLNVVEGPKGLFISMPQRQTEQDGSKKYIDIAHPVSSEMRKASHDAILDAYSQTMALSQQFKSNFHGNQKTSESVPSQGNAKSEDLPTEVKTDQDDAEDTTEDEAPAPIMGQMM